MHGAANIFLVGMMGAGKTTIGKALARALGRAFVDCDQELERRTGVTVRMIFELEGEAGFRAREAQLLEELTALPGVVLATGGGAVLDPANRARLSARGFVIYLRASARDLWFRTRNDRSRPLLQTADPLGRLEALFQVRDPLYTETADLIIDSGRQRSGALIGRILPQLPEQCRVSA
jgi:shikimate kinase